MTSLDAERARELCADPPSRVVVAALATERRALTVNDLTKAVVLHEFQQPITEVDGAAVRDVEATVASAVVPRLADADVVRYDAERGHVEPGPRFDDLRERVEAELDVDLELDDQVREWDDRDRERDGRDRE